MSEQDDLLIARYFDGRLNADEIAALTARIESDPDFRVELVRAGRQDAYLREVLQVKAGQPVLPTDLADTAHSDQRSPIKGGARFKRRAWILSLAAAVVLCAVGVWLRQASVSPAPIIARLTPIPGVQVTVLRGQTQYVADANFPLESGDAVSTPSGPDMASQAIAATVVYPDGTQVAVAPDSQVEWTDGPNGKAVQVRQGSTVSEVAPQPAGRPMRFTSRYGQATVVGTKLRFAVDPTGARLEVTEGHVELRRTVDGDTAMVSAGQYAVAAPQGGSALAVLPLPDGVPAAEEFVETFDAETVGSTPTCAAGPDKAQWKIAADTNGNHYAQADAVDLVELEVGRKWISNYHLAARFQVASPETSVGIYTPFYGVENLTWGLEIQGTSLYLLSGATNPTVIGTSGRTAVAQLKPLSPNQWHDLKITVDAHAMTAEIDGQTVLLDLPNFMQPGLWRFFGKGGRVQFDDLKVANIPH